MLNPAEYVRAAQLRQPLRAMVPALVDDIQAATGKKVIIPPRGAVRTTQEQIDLWNDRANNPYPVAQPGTSRHEFGGAIDLNIVGGTDADYATMAVIAESKYGLEAGLYFDDRYPGKREDKVHLQMIETLPEAQLAWAQRSDTFEAVVVDAVANHTGLVLVGVAVVALAFTSSSED